MPLPVISIEQMRLWEKATWASGQTEAEVIRRVGRVVAEHAVRLTRKGDRILILCGNGHNGDDARGAREHLEHRQVAVLEVTSSEPDVASLERELARHPALVIDGLFGIGINRPLAAAWQRFFQRLNAANVSILAVDTPSGLNANTGQPEGAAIKATVTLTVGAPKAGLLKETAWPFVGRLEVAADVGLVPCSLVSELNWILPSDFTAFPRARSVATHKGSYGHVAIVAGSLGFHGASVLAARGAQRAQPGLITLYTLEGVYPVVASQLQAVMVSIWQQETELKESSTALLAGPGLAGPDVPAALKGFLQKLWRDSPLPMVVDASALSWLPAASVPLRGVRVITPHPGEAARLLGWTTTEIQADRVKALRSLAAKLGDPWVVLKGHQTLIGRSTGEIHVNSSGNPHLAQGGSGDVLSGYLAGLLAQPRLQSDPAKTISYAVWQHGATADHLQERRPNWIVEDLIAALGQAEHVNQQEGNASGLTETYDPEQP